MMTKRARVWIRGLLGLLASCGLLLALDESAQAQQRIGVCVPGAQSAAIYELAVREFGQANVVRACGDDERALSRDAMGAFALREDVTIFVWLATDAAGHASSITFRARNVATNAEQSMRIDMPPATIDRRAAVQAIGALVRMVSQPGSAAPAPPAPEPSATPEAAAESAASVGAASEAAPEPVVDANADVAVTATAAVAETAPAAPPVAAEAAAPPPVAPAPAPATPPARRAPRRAPEDDLPLDWALIFSLGTRTLNEQGFLTYGLGIRGAVPAGRHFMIGGGLRFASSPAAGLWQLQVNLPDVALLLRSSSNSVELRLGVRPLVTLNHGDPSAAHGRVSVGLGTTLEASVNIPMSAHTRINVGGLADFSWTVLQGHGPLHLIQFFTAFAFDL